MKPNEPPATGTPPGRPAAPRPAQGADLAANSEAGPTAEVVPLSRLRSDVARSLARRGQALLVSDSMAEEVARCAPLELYYLIKELGSDEAGPLLRAASPEQFSVLCDFDCWEADGFVAEELDAWLAPLLEEGPDALPPVFLALDEEVQVLFLQASLRVLDNREQDGGRRDGGEIAWPSDVAEDAPHQSTPEGFFTLIDITHAREVPPLLLVNALYQHDTHETFRLLTAARWELPSPLMEQGRHFRQGRMEDLGFCSSTEAARLFAPPPANASGAGAPPLGTHAPYRAGSAPQLPALYAEALADGDCALVQAMAQVRAPAQLSALEQAWIVLINAAVVAYGHAPKDVAHVGRVAGWVRDTVSLGLLSRSAALGLGDTPEALAAVLTDVPLVRLFQGGVAAVRPLQRRAQAALQRPEVRAWLDGAPVADSFDPQGQARAFLRALCHARPLWGGQVPLRPEERRAWRSPAEVATATKQLEGLLQDLFAGPAAGA